MNIEAHSFEIDADPMGDPYLAKKTQGIFVASTISYISSVQRIPAVNSSPETNNNQTGLHFNYHGVKDSGAIVVKPKSTMVSLK